MPLLLSSYSRFFRCRGAGARGRQAAGGGGRVQSAVMPCRRGGILYSLLPPAHLIFPVLHSQPFAQSMT